MPLIASLEFLDHQLPLLHLYHHREVPLLDLGPQPLLQPLALSLVALPFALPLGCLLLLYLVPRAL